MTDVMYIHKREGVERTLLQCVRRLTVKMLHVKIRCTSEVISPLICVID